MSFFYQEMDVYYIALGFVDSIFELLRRLKSTKHELLETLENRAIEIPLSIARIAGESGSKITAAGYYKIRGNVFECQAIVELLWRQKLIEEKDSEELGDTLLVMDNLLSDLAGSVPRETEKKIPIYRPKSKLLE